MESFETAGYCGGWRPGDLTDWWSNPARREETSGPAFSCRGYIVVAVSLPYKAVSGTVIVVFVLGSQCRAEENVDDAGTERSNPSVMHVFGSRNTNWH